MKKNFLLITLAFSISFILFGCALTANTTTASTASTVTTIPTTTTTTTTTVQNQSLPLTILSMNDLHGYIEQDDSGKGGLANTAYLINQIRNADNLDDTVLIANGDMFQGTAISNMTDGRAVLDCMNEMEFDAMGIGNHEFDWGIGTILNYFDGNPDNGEANFPLINDNIYLKSNNTLLTVDGGNVVSSVVVDKDGVKVGILSYIGNVYSSIEFDKVQDYYFDENIASSVKTAATALKAEGVNVIIVNIHGGGSSITTFSPNVELSQLKDANGEYLVDAVINGHTHAYQVGAIKRDGGVDMPVIQAASYNEYFGDITLNVNLSTKTVTGSAEKNVAVSSAGTNYDPQVETIIDNYKSQLGNQVLATAGETVTSKSQLFNWTGNVMLAATGADFAISNTGGVRATGDITKGEPVTMDQLYQISPFDNNIYIITTTYGQIKSFLNDSAIFYTSDGKTFSDSDTVKVAIISFVYFWSELDNIRNDNDVNTGLYIRNILADDLLQKTADGDLFMPISHPEASIGLEYQAVAGSN